MNTTAPPTSSAEILKGRLLLIAAATLWSTSGLILKSPPMEALPQESRGPLLACLRALFAAIVLMPFVRRRAIRWRAGLLPMVVSFTLMNLLFVSAMAWTSAAATVFLQYTSTGWAFLFGLLFLREPLERGNLLALAFAFCGIGWIVAGDWGSENLLGNLLALGSGVCFAGVILSLRALRVEDSFWLVTLNHAVAAAALLPWVITLDVRLNALQWLVAALLGTFQIGVPYVLFARGVRHVATQEAALLVLLEPVLNPFWVLIFWGNSPRPETWIGGGLIVGGLVVRYLFFSSKRQPVPDEP